MEKTQPPAVKNGDHCSVVAGTHKGKLGIVGDLKTSETGAITVTVTQSNGVRFKTLAKNVVVQPGGDA